MGNNNNVDITDITKDGWIQLACAIGAVRSQEYRVAYDTYLRSPTDANLRLVKRWEDKLKGPITSLSDDELAKIRKDVVKHGAFAFDCSY